jgi:lipopolysaccharide/colanic/teichoic acid biosynthesis glycosyltransferase
MTHPLAKRSFDLLCSTAGLIVLSPVLLGLAVAVRASDCGPAFFRQVRVGRRGVPFRIWKYRTMVVGADRLGPGVTRGGDPRITRIGRLLRRTKLDELPQLFNVFTGDMTLVGPRPEVPRYVDQYTPAQRAVLELKPGITDPATLAFRDEEELLRRADDMERFYLEQCVPRKIRMNLDYARRATFWTDLGVVLRTLLPMSGRRHSGD